MKSELKGMHEDPKPAEPEAAVVVDDAAAPVVVQDVPRTVVVEEIPQPVVVAAQHNGRR